MRYAKSMTSSVGISKSRQPQLKEEAKKIDGDLLASLGYLSQTHFLKALYNCRKFIKVYILAMGKSKNYLYT
uniref:Uncharacterized protein n=1 Tax=Cyanothece sp. (strain PCC 7425 / ATCC 29141) TaxID=395961 RepID=B8HNC2_CYAP4